MDEFAQGARYQGPHVPVLLREVLDALAPLDGALVVDGTFGAGGYSRALIEAGANVTAIDRDPDVARFAEPLAKAYPQRFTFRSGRFGALDALASEGVDAVVLDIGVSSMQIDTAGRGFSFQKDGPLDMRMGGEGESAADLVNRLDERALSDLLFGFGEERQARRIAAAIVAARSKAPIATTGQLAALIETTLGHKPGAMHPATRSFQALRIAVNAELDELVDGLFAAERLLAAGGRLAVVTFHSLEDRIVKRFLAPETAGSRHLPTAEAAAPRWQPVRKPVRAGAAELAANPRARSATLRSAVRSAAPARPVSARGLGVPFSLRGAA
ncbi:MAG: 16S rRNA (cytosine(1402)-N(4))-methyltransferase RsmH [Alphaproteobacteria bacterium]|nr:16S rRNA (cytosine(1402)-N(4))-methyltransferase RsmH [Alphaproteobacteria bacterium]